MLRYIDQPHTLRTVLRLLLSVCLSLIQQRKQCTSLSERCCIYPARRLCRTQTHSPNLLPIQLGTPGNGTVLYYFDMCRQRTVHTATLVVDWTFRLGNQCSWWRLCLPTGLSLTLVDTAHKQRLPQSYTDPQHMPCKLRLLC